LMKRISSRSIVSHFGLLSVIFSVSAGCTKDEGATNIPLDESEPALTYHRDIKPIIEERCESCHTEGGGEIAWFGLATYNEVRMMHAQVLDSIADKRMPPWPPSPECADLKNAQTVAETDEELLIQWVDLGMPEGRAQDFVSRAPADTAKSGDLDAIDLRFDIGDDYKPQPDQGEFDDLRCFFYDPELTTDAFLNGFHAVPTNNKIAHHMLVYAVPASKRTQLESLQGAAPGPGYPCHGGPGVAQAQLVAGWVPGARPIEYPEGTGLRIDAASIIVVQMHYNTINDPDGVDRSQLQMRFTDGPADTPLMLTSIRVPDLYIPAGDENNLQDISKTIPAETNVYGIAPHMHTFGTGISVHLGTSSGQDLCMIDIPRWDFDWQGIYNFQEPILVERGSDIKIECRYNNGPNNQPIDQMPQDIRWGERTVDEMCLVYFVTDEVQR
jgi:hypothetical protein